jgi:hypothetical protein
MAKSPIRLDELFKGRHFEREVIVLCVRWYLRFKLSFRDLVQMRAERGLSRARLWCKVRFHAQIATKQMNEINGLRAPKIPENELCTRTSSEEARRGVFSYLGSMLAWERSSSARSSMASRIAHGNALTLKVAVD